MNRLIFGVAICTLLFAVAIPAGAVGDSDAALDDGDLAAWTDPTSAGVGPVLDEAGEETFPSLPSDADPFEPSATPGPSDVVISGTGWGHGIGMSQYGAYARAVAGSDHVHILSFYYPGATTVRGVADEPLWVGLKQEVVKVRLTVKKIAGNPVPVTVSRDTDTLTLGDGQSVTIEYTGIVGNVRQCTFSGPDYTSPAGPCMIDLKWDGGAADPTTRVVVDRVWYADTPVEGEACTHRVSPYTLECAYNRGVMHIRPDDVDAYDGDAEDTGFNIVLEINRDAYVLGIGEVPYSWPTEALETQAVSSRTFASYISERRGPPEDRPGCWCNVYGGYPDQTYLGWGFGTQRWVDAVRATDGEVVTYDGKTIGAFFSASNGGATENNEDIWYGGSPRPYLRSSMDVWSRHPRNTRGLWDAAIPLSQFASMLGFDTVESAEIVSRYESGTPSDIVVTGTSGGEAKTAHFTGPMFRREFHLRSPHVNQIRWPFTPGKPAVTRRGGADRYETAVAVSWSNFAAKSHPSVVVVRGDRFPDALAAAPFARRIEGPVLLTPPASLPGIVRAELKRLEPGRIYVVGGVAAISGAVERQLAGFAPVERISGPDRFATAARVSQQTARRGVDTVFVASGTRFPDAVAGSAEAASLTVPLLLTTRDVLPGPTRDELARLRPRRVVVLGGSAVVGPGVISEIRKYTDAVTVLGGANRYETAVEISRWGHADETGDLYLATGKEFADALAGAAIAGAKNGPILLLSGDELDPTVANEITRLAPSRITLLGGPAAISYSIQDSVDDR